MAHLVGLFLMLLAVPAFVAGRAWWRGIVGFNRRVAYGRGRDDRPVRFERATRSFGAGFLFVIAAVFLVFGLIALVTGR